MSASRKPPARSREAAPTPSLKNRRSQAKPLQLALAELEPATPLLNPIVRLRQLWLSIYLPALPLEALVNTSAAAVVFEEQQGVRKVLLANAKAMASSIVPGISVNAALALLPDLQLLERNPAREESTLKSLAGWAGKFTSFTSVEPPSLLLLEIAGSLTLFCGVKKLQQHIKRGLTQQGLSATVAIAPTAFAATWLARAGRSTCITDPRHLVGEIGGLPLSCLGWPEDIYKSLTGTGVSTIGEILRLPREGFARRFGAMRLLELDRALGRLPDPRVNYRAPEHFIADFELHEEESDTALLLNACRELLLRLEDFLLRRQMAVQHIEFSFFHLQKSATGLSLGRVQAGRVAEHWFDLLEIKLNRMILPAPAIAIRLCGGQGRQFNAETEVLRFDQQDRQRHHSSIAHLAERISTHIGENSVHGVTTVAEHRPQHAWKACDAFEMPNCASMPASRVNAHLPELLAETRRTSSLVLQRPLWILKEPQLLKTAGKMPCYQGPLKLIAGPERLESGWWDDDGIARDYFVAVNTKGVRLWVYRDHGKTKRESWYLHGMFG